MWRGRDGDPRSSHDVFKRATADHDDDPAARIRGNVRGRPAHGHVRRRESADTSERNSTRCIDADDGDDGALSGNGTARFCTDRRRAASCLRSSLPSAGFAHGFDATPALYASLLSGWASAGYVVVAPTIPLLNADAPGGPSHTDYGVSNITDLDFALNEALRRSATPGDPIAGLIDPNRIAVAGHSDGEVLAYALAFEGCCHDARVKAVIPMAGNLANAEAAPSATGVPVLHIMNDHDQYDPYAASIAWDRQNLPAPRYLLTLVSETHAPAFTDPSDPHFDLVVRATVDFLDGTLNGRADTTAALQSLVAGAPNLATLETAGAPPAT